MAKKEFVIEEGRGFLFKNNFKTKENQPDYTGNATVDGKKKKVSLWKKTTKKGDPMLSITIADPVKKEEVNSDDLPF